MANPLLQFDANAKVGTHHRLHTVGAAHLARQPTAEMQAGIVVDGVAVLTRSRANAYQGTRVAPKAVLVWPVQCHGRAHLSPRAIKMQGKAVGEHVKKPQPSAVSVVQRPLLDKVAQVHGQWPVGANVANELLAQSGRRVSGRVFNAAESCGRKRQRRLLPYPHCLGARQQGEAPSRHGLGAHVQAAHD